MWARTRGTAIGGVALVLLAAAVASAAVVQSGGLRITALAQIKPYKLPRDKPAPIAVFVAGHLQASGGGIPPQLQRMTVQVNKHGLLQSMGLPVCQVPEVQPASTERALANCSDAVIGSGQTKLTLDKGFLSFLKKNGIALTAKAGAKRGGSSITLPVASGNVDPTLGKSVPLRKVTVKAKKDVLTAKRGGSQLKVATSAKLSAKRAGFGTSLKLRPEAPFEEGQLLGTLTSNAQPKLLTILDQGRATLVFDSAFAAKLDAHFVSLNPIFPAEHVGATFTFPIAAGSQLAPNESTPAFPGKLGRIGILDLGSASVTSDPKARTISLASAPLTLQAQAAAQLNEALAGGKGDFVAGEAVGALSFTAQGQ